MKKKNLGTALLILLIVGMVYALRVAPYDGNPSALITIGRQWSRFAALETTLAPGLVVLDKSHGYDGFSYYLMARDPFLQRDEWKDVKCQRLIYPLAAWMVALGQEAWIPVTLPLVNAVAIFILALVLARRLKREGRSTWLAPWAALNAGMIGAFAYDLAEPIAMLTLVLALLSYEGGRLIPATLWMALSIWTRESHCVFAAGLVLHALMVRSGWRWVLLGAAGLPWFLWCLWITPKTDVSPLAASAGSFGAPFVGLVDHLVECYALEGSSFWRRDALLIPWALVVFFITGRALVSLKVHRDLPSLLILMVGMQAIFFQAPMWGGILTASRLHTALFPLLIFAPAPAAQSFAWKFVVAVSLGFSALMVLRCVRVPAELLEFSIT